MKDFPDVFPNDLPKIYPDQEIDFCINLLHMSPITIPLYHMAPAESKELKLQVKNLLNKGFIQPSISP